MPQKLTKQLEFELQELNGAIEKKITEVAELCVKKALVLSKFNDIEMNKKLRDKLKQYEKELQKLKLENDNIKNSLRNLL